MKASPCAAALRREALRIMSCAAQEGLPGCCNGLACTLGGPVSLCKRAITFHIHAHNVVVTQQRCGGAPHPRTAASDGRCTPPDHHIALRLLRSIP